MSPELPPGLHEGDLAVRAAFVPRLQALASAVSVPVPPEVAWACGTHYALLVRWNKTHNLSRIVDADDAALKHYLDCAAPFRDALPELQQTVSTPARVIDVGSGAGFPGLVAQIVWASTGWAGTPWASAPAPPELVLVEPSRKRQSFLRVAIGALGLSGVRVIEPPPVGQLEGAVVLTRATFSAGARRQLWPYVAPGGTLVAWTTPHERSMWESDISMWPAAHVTWKNRSIGELQRSILCVRRAPNDGGKS